MIQKEDSRRITLTSLHQMPFEHGLHSDSRQQPEKLHLRKCSIAKERRVQATWPQLTVSRNGADEVFKKGSLLRHGKHPFTQFRIKKKKAA